MPKGILFWVLMILWLVIGMGAVWYDGPYRRPALTGGSLLLFALLLLLGWAIFGPPLQ